MRQQQGTNMKKIDHYIPKNMQADIFGNVATFEVDPAFIQEIVRELKETKHLTLKLIDATDERKQSGSFKVWYVFGVPKDNYFIIPFIRVDKTNTFPSVTSISHAAGGYERRIKTFFGLTPVGHPDLRPIILHENWPQDIFPLRKDFDSHRRPVIASGSYAFQHVSGEGIYEIPVGPIHAGIIEPGHFRFSMAGESIMLLEARLGYVHKGSEKLFEQLSLPHKVKLSEKISGDSSFSHSLAFVQAVERLAHITVPEKAQYLRTIYAELERLANHLGDLGLIMLDTGFNFGGAQGSRLRETMMRINERLTGNRFMRGVNAIGGVTQDMSETQKAVLATELARILNDFEEVIAIAENSVSVLNRLKSTGPLPRDIADDYGVLGVPARAVGIAADTRFDYPYAAYGKLSLGDIPTETNGDVYARFRVRVKEVRTTMEILQAALAKLPIGPIAILPDTEIKFERNAVAISNVEGWRGEIIYFIKTNDAGEIERVIPRDPSFINWQVVGYCGNGQIVPDFPLINKSFNLSYTGNDL